MKERMFQAHIIAEIDVFKRYLQTLTNKNTIEPYWE